MINVENQLGTLPLEAGHSQTQFPSGPDIFRLYLSDVSETPLLTAEEELALALRVQAGDEEARERMIRANLRLVIKIARSYENFGLPLLDLISEGNMGLMKAVDRFDPSRGVKLSTYAAWWIKQFIRRALANQAKTIRVPVYILSRLAELRRTESRLHCELERPPTPEELAAEFGAEEDSIACWRRANAPLLSMDATVGDEDGTTYGEIIPDEAADAPSSRLETQINHATVLRLLAQLPDRYAQVLRWRFGLDHGDNPTLEQIGFRLQVSRERVRQIESAALRKLRKLLYRERKLRLAA